MSVKTFPQAWVSETVQQVNMLAPKLRVLSSTLGPWRVEGKHLCLQGVLQPPCMHGDMYTHMHTCSYMHTHTYTEYTRE